ncbi:P-loop containing nucleoside triphosphate hydrolase protein [Aspergillus campestris IBT 28561]|uniref:RNA helicase n=1 Tax=Aspergillus campestris (strain IBT 28561) TaxID=1392248 RepID=A0A2I1CZH1_ASPC2|nr:P-loop containing nucleoside triphosphate hydrolase protein [Aspergillus campestris IBT 28561]PKY03024.1 P-loop containing nucleoside triphosphate hydrolase protein [Aspergillus campestris IBT 28561]
MDASRQTSIVLKGSPKLPLQLAPQIERLLHGKIELCEVQSLIIPLIATQRDILAISTPGLGVTTACVYGIMNALCLDATTEPGPKAIILLPTRELAIQVYETFERLRPAHKLQIQMKISHSDHPTSDGTSAHFDVVVGTPGKVLGAVQSGALSLDSVRYYMFDEVWSLLGDTGEGEQRLDTLARLIAPILSQKKTIIFTNRLDEAEAVQESLSARFPGRAIGLLAKSIGTYNREVHLDAFQRGQYYALVTCRLFYAGVDLSSEISCVVFYTPPPTITHTITGRLRLTAAGGEMITILDPEAKDEVERMEYIRGELRDLQHSRASVFDNTTDLQPSLNSSTAASSKLIIRGLANDVNVRILMGALQHFRPVRVQVEPAKLNNPKSVTTAFVWFPTEPLATLCLREIDGARLCGTMVMAGYALEKQGKR